MASSHPLPILISATGPNVLLERVPLTGYSGTSAYSEDWLQDLLYKHPESLPIAEINPAFSGLIPICREMQTPVGPIDVLYVTREGRIAVLEAKLWRNPEARRKVIGQILDYAKELSHWTYETLDAAIRSARRRDQGAAQSLFEVVRAQNAELDEAQFIDSVSRSLRRGDLLLLISVTAFARTSVPLRTSSKTTEPCILPSASSRWRSTECPMARTSSSREF